MTIKIERAIIVSLDDKESILARSVLGIDDNTIFLKVTVEEFFKIPLAKFVSEDVVFGDEVVLFLRPNGSHKRFNKWAEKLN